MPNHAHFFQRVILTPRVGHTDLVFDTWSGCRSGTQYYKSLCAVVAICSTLVNIQTDRQTHANTQISTAHHQQFASAGSTMRTASSRQNSSPAMCSGFFRDFRKTNTGNL